MYNNTYTWNKGWCWQHSGSYNPAGGVGLGRVASVSWKSASALLILGKRRHVKWIGFKRTLFIRATHSRRIFGVNPNATVSYYFDSTEFRFYFFLFCFVLPSTSLWGVYSETFIHRYRIPLTHAFTRLCMIFFPHMYIPHYASSPWLQRAQFSFLSFSQ